MRLRREFCRMDFIKIQALGNDFVILQNPPVLSPAHIQHISDRRRGWVVIKCWPSNLLRPFLVIFSFWIFGIGMVQRRRLVGMAPDV